VKPKVIFLENLTFKKNCYAWLHWSIITVA